MRQVKLLSMVLMAIFALAAVLSTAASAALPLILPLGAERTWKGINDEKNPQLVSLNGTVTCVEAVASGTEEKEKPLGLFHIEFRKCKLGIVPCTGLGDANEVILSLGLWHLVWDQLKPELLVATLFLPELTHFICGLVLIDVHGQLLCLDLEAASEKLSHLFHCHQQNALQLDKVYWNEEGKEITNVELLCSENEGALLHCGELALGLVEHSKPLFADI